MTDWLPIHISPHAAAIFRQEHLTYSLFYTPGYLVVVPAPEATRFTASLLDAQLTHPEALNLYQQAQTVRRRWDALQTTPFAPVCLTFYLHNQCNLFCPYCYAKPSPLSSPRLNLRTIRDAAALVAANCQHQASGMTLVCHGGGEPALDQPYLAQVLHEVEAVAQQAHVPLFRYLATNGVFPSATARFLAEKFDLLGLSCDGPPDIQARQRPLWGGQNSAPYVENSARIWREQGIPFHVRVTITPQSVARQSEIAHYLCQILKPAAIHVEPVYGVGRATPSMTLHDAEEFVIAFLAAQQVAQQYGLRWQYSGSRVNEIHGPYCHLFRQVLNLIPGDTATACFKITQAEQAKAAGVQLRTYALWPVCPQSHSEYGQETGSSSPVSSRLCSDPGEYPFLLDKRQIDYLRQVLFPLPEQCRDCFNQYHCVRGCPEVCPLDDAAAGIPAFRCQLQKTLTQARLDQITAQVRDQINAGIIIGREVLPL